MKKLYLLIVSFFFSFFSAQMDTEHWFAPMASTETWGIEVHCYLYLSTDQTTPFQVKIYNGGSLYQTVNISKGNPGIVSVNSDLMIADDSNKKFAVNTMGLYLQADQKFFAHFRMLMPNHAEIITSKGKAGLGKEFYAYTPENSAPRPYINSTVGITATEDGTTVSIDNFRSLQLSNFEAVTPATVKTIQLNKGQSYVLECIGLHDLLGLRGIHITANKDITVTSGSLLYIAPNRNNVDIFMDQASPLDRIGTDYIAVKGNGNLSKDMERVAVMATEDNTAVYLNGSSAPSYIIPKKGDVFLTPSSAYMAVSAANDIYNLYIKTDKPAYAYQHLAGVNNSVPNANGSDNDYASGGMNILPALSCLLPNVIDEFAKVDQIGYDSFNTRLNIITQTGARILVNGVAPSPESGPYPVSGNNGWVTYTLKPATGNIKIESDKAVTAGIAAGNGAVGYGGYFAGFNSIPVVAKGGDCSTGAPYLEVDNTYNSYQWYRDGEEYTGAGAKTYRITSPPPGIYYAVIEKKACPGKKQSPEYKILSCTVASTLTYTVCSNLNITPKLSQSAQETNPSTIRIVTPPTNGTVTVSGGKIIYTPNAGTPTGTSDTFSYYFEGVGTYPDSETVTVNVNYNRFTVTNTELFACDASGTFTFNLNDANLTSVSGVTKKFYENRADAEAGTIGADISNPDTFRTALPKKIYARVSTADGCNAIAEIELKSYPIPNLDISKLNKVYCDDDLDGKITIRFSDVTPVIVNNPQDFDVIYTLKGSGTVLPNDFSFTSDTAVNVEVKSKNGCPSVTGTLDFIVGKPVSIVGAVNTDVCDNALNGSASINLSDYSALFTDKATATFYSTETDAKLKRKPITSNQTISGDAPFYYRFENSSDCPAVGVLNIHFKQPKKSELLTNTEICSSTTINLSVEDGFSSYLWSNGSTTKDSGQLPVGSYWVDLGYNGCVYRQTVTVSAAPEPVIKEIKVTGKNAEVFVTDGSAPYTYALDNGDWQSSPSFNSILTGRHKISVKDSKGCTVAEKEFLILNLINAITPNGDGINDKLDYSDLVLKKNVLIEVYDRYGKLLYHSNDRYIWDGTVSGRTVPTGTYWYILKWTEENGENMQYVGWILIKNQ